MTQHLLYRCYDADGALLYVGVSANIEQRRLDHSKTKPWWRNVKRIETEACADRNAAYAAEREAIKKELPRFNSAHHPDPLPIAQRWRGMPLRTVRINDELWEELLCYARINGETAANVLRRALERYVRDQRRKHAKEQSGD